MTNETRQKLEKFADAIAQHITDLDGESGEWVKFTFEDDNFGAELEYTAEIESDHGSAWCPPHSWVTSEKVYVNAFWDLDEGEEHEECRKWLENMLN